nr:putative retrotransposon protein [Tanacetum cinerariifolium]
VFVGCAENGASFGFTSFPPSENGASFGFTSLCIIKSTILAVRADNFYYLLEWEPKKITREEGSNHYRTRVFKMDKYKTTEEIYSQQLQLPGQIISATSKNGSQKSSTVNMRGRREQKNRHGYLSHKKGARHFKRKYHYVRECIETDEIDIVKVRTDDNLADPFTKALAGPKLTRHARSMGLRPASSFM